MFEKVKELIKNVKPEHLKIGAAALAGFGAAMVTFLLSSDSNDEEPVDVVNDPPFDTDPVE